MLKYRPMRVTPSSPYYYAAYRTHPQRVEDYSKRNFTKEILDSERRVAQIESETADYRVELSSRQIHQSETTES